MKTVRLLSFCQRYACSPLSPAARTHLHTHIDSFPLSLSLSNTHTRAWAHTFFSFFSRLFPSRLLSFPTRRNGPGTPLTPRSGVASTRSAKLHRRGTPKKISNYRDEKASRRRSSSLACNQFRALIRTTRCPLYLFPSVETIVDLFADRATLSHKATKG